MAEVIIFAIFATVAVAGALVMLLHANPVYCALGLMATMLALAVFYVVNQGHFLAAVQVIVYAGAVMTLFLFVIVLIGVDHSENLDERLPVQRPLAVALMAAFVTLVVIGARAAWVIPAGTGVEPNGTIEAMADLIFDEWVLPFEITTLLLIIAAVGAIALGHGGTRRVQE